MAQRKQSSRTQKSRTAKAAVRKVASSSGKVLPKGKKKPKAVSEKGTVAAGGSPAHPKPKPSKTSTPPAVVASGLDRRAMPKYAGAEIVDQVVVSFRPPVDPTPEDAEKLRTALSRTSATVLRERSGMVQVQIAPEDRPLLIEALEPLNDWEVAAESVARIPKS